MTEHGLSGYQSRRPRGPLLIATELRLEEMRGEVRHLSRRLIRLRAAAREYLTALPSDQGVARARLRHELGQDDPGCAA